MNEQTQIKAREYQRKLEELFSPQFQADLLEVCIETYGEDSREQFEKNFKRISMYPKFNLNSVHAMSDKEQYLENTSYSIMKSVYDKFDIDPNDYRGSTLEEYLKGQFTGNNFASYTTCCVDKDTDEVCYPIFIEMSRKRNDDELRGTIAHEVLHALEFIAERDENGLRAKTGHYGFNETGKNVLTAECLHVGILFAKIYPMLREKGYEITDSNDYLFTMGEGFFKFFGTYFQQICRTALQPDLHELTDVIGVDNWNQFVELQNNKTKKGLIGLHAKEEKEQIVIVGKMQEYSRNSLAERIGKATLTNQLDIEGKNKVKGQLDQLTYDKEDSKIEK